MESRVKQEGSLFITVFIVAVGIKSNIQNIKSRENGNIKKIPYYASCGLCSQEDYGSVPLSYL